MTLADPGINSLTRYGKDEGVATPLGSGSPRIIYEAEDLALATWLYSVTIELTGNPVISPVFRVLAKMQLDCEYQYVFPFDAAVGEAFTSGTTVVFPFPIRLPKGSSFQIEVSNASISGGGANGQVTSLEFIEFRP